METTDNTSPVKSACRKKVVHLSAEQEQKILSWLAEGMDVKTVALLFEQETGESPDAAAIIAIWQKHAAKIHLDRRNYFAKLAAGLVDGAFFGEQALDAANAYLLKQTLFECLIDPDKDPKQIELLVKAIKTVASEKPTETDVASENRSVNGLSDDTLRQIEDIVKII